MTRISTPFSSWTPLNRSREYPQAISAFADVSQSDDVEFFAGRPDQLKHFDLSAAINTVSGVAQKAEQLGAQVQGFIAQSNLGPPSINQQQQQLNQEALALQNQASSALGSAKTPLLVGGGIVVLLIVILVIKKFI